MRNTFAAQIAKLIALYLALNILVPSAMAIETHPPIHQINTTADQPVLARIALVIGNSDYAQKPLVSPVKDAQTVAEQLGKLGFYVIVQENTSVQALQQSLREFSTLLQATKGIGLFYYAGHGIQIDGANYLIPVDVDLRRAQDVLHQSLSVNEVLNQLGQAANQSNIVIIDACRDNPFAKRSGLAPLSYAKTPGNTFIAFATAPGSVAIDGDNNGLFTQYLLTHLKTPNLPIEQLFKQVRQGVMQASRGVQIPWEHSSLTGDFYFNPPDLAAVAKASTTAVAHAWGMSQNELLAAAINNSAFLRVDPNRLQLGPALVRSSSSTNTADYPGNANTADNIDHYVKTAQIYLQQNDTTQAMLYLEKAFTLSHRASSEQINTLSALYNLALAEQ